MWQKKETLLRWVNCNSDSSPAVDRIKSLANGVFFKNILDSLRSTNLPDSSSWHSPWFTNISSILKDNKVDDDTVDFNLASAGNEEELSKLIVICMYLTMVKRPCEAIKENTILNLSVDDQKIIKSILLEIVRDDRITRTRLIEVLHETAQESINYSVATPVTFYASSPLSSMPRNSPLKRFLDSPMALRLSRLQKELNDKNEEIRRLQSEVIVESDESATLKRQVEELHRKVRQFERSNSELRQRLDDCQPPDDTGLNADAEITKLKKHLKKLQDECETTSQKFCNLNMENEALKNQKEKDRKQIRQHQQDLNDALARFERESAEFQLLLDSIRTENVELKHTLEEKSQWIDVLEERTRACTEMHVRSNAPKSPSENESIGYSLLSLEADKLRVELEAHQKELVTQSDKFESEKHLLLERLDCLSKDNSELSLQIQEASTLNGSLQNQLDKSKSEFERLVEGNAALLLEKNQLEVTLSASFLQHQKEVESLKLQVERRTEEVTGLNNTLEKLKEEIIGHKELEKKLEQSVGLLLSEKVKMEDKVSSLETSLLDIQAVSRQDFENISSQLASRQLEIARHLGNISHLEEELVSVKEKLEIAGVHVTQLENEKSRLEGENALLQISQTELESTSRNLGSRIVELSQLSESTRSHLEVSLKKQECLENRSAELESMCDSLRLERNGLKEQVAELDASSRAINDSLQTEKETHGVEIASKDRLILEQSLRIKEIQLQVEENAKEAARLEGVVRTLELEVANVVESRSVFERRSVELEKALEIEKNEKQAVVNQAELDAEEQVQLLNQRNSVLQHLQVQLEEQTQKAIDVSMKMEAAIAENNQIAKEKESLLAEVTQLKTALSEQQKTHAAAREELKEEMESRIQRMSELSFREVSSLEAELAQANISTELLASQIEQLRQERNNLMEQHLGFKEELRTLKETLKNNQEHISATSEHNTHLQQHARELNEKLSVLESERDAVNFERGNFEQMYLDVKAACEEAEAKVQLENEMASEQQAAYDAAQDVLQRELEDLRIDMEINQKQLEVERKTSKTTETKLLEANKSLKEQELQIGHLTSEIQELSRKKTILECENDENQALVKELERANEELNTRICNMKRENLEREEQAKAEFKLEFTRLENVIAIQQAEKSELHKNVEEKECRLSKSQEKLAQLTARLELTSTLKVDSESKLIDLEAEQTRLKLEKDRLEKQQEANQTTLRSVQSELTVMTSESKQKTSELTQLGIAISNLKLELSEAVAQKDSLERALAEKTSALNNANRDATTIEQAHQQLKADLEAEQRKTLQLKAESLEHRKEKAALEGRLNLSEAQKKSMQEKLVNLTVANQSQAPLEHKINTLTNELEVASKIIVGLESKLKEAGACVKEEIIEKPKTTESESEITILRKKYEAAKNALAHKDDVINQYASKFEKMQLQLDDQADSISTLTIEKRKLTFENRTLKTEQQHLLAQMAAEKDKAAARNSRHTLALQRGISDGGTLSDFPIGNPMIDSRRRTLRSTRSEVVTARPYLAEEPSRGGKDGIGNDSIFKVPSSRRESTSSVCSNASTSTLSRGANIPQGAGRLFSCDDEDGELFSSSYLNEMKEGKCKMDEDTSLGRMSELHRRNTLQPPHMRSAYPVEMNDERLRSVDAFPDANGSVNDSRRESIQQLTVATSLLSMNTPPAMNTRKRRSSNWSQCDTETPSVAPRKRRSYEFDAEVSMDSTDSRSLLSSAERKKRREGSQTTYQRPGPPTPAKHSVKENIATRSSSLSSSPPKATPKTSTKLGSKPASSPAPANRSSNRVTPASLVKRVQSKLRTNKQSASEQNTPSTTPRGRSKLNIFRRPLGSRGYNSDAKL